MLSSESDETQLDNSLDVADMELTKEDFDMVISDVSDKKNSISSQKASCKRSNLYPVLLVDLQHQHPHMH